MTLIHNEVIIDPTKIKQILDEKEADTIEVVTNILLEEQRDGKNPVGYEVVGNIIKKLHIRFNY